MRIVQEAMALIWKTEEYNEKDGWIENTELPSKRDTWLIQECLPTSRLQSW